MIPESSPFFYYADRIADAVNPILILCLVLFLIAATRRKEVDWRTWVSVLLGIVIVYALHRADHKLHLWEQLGGDYSTHSAMAAALIIPLAFIRRKLWPILAGVLICYIGLMIVLGFHTVLDIALTLLVIVPLVLLVHFIFTRKSGAVVEGST